ncbi:MAG: glycoside hydrolase family 27 protein [Jejuia sp.]
MLIIFLVLVISCKQNPGGNNSLQEVGSANINKLLKLTPTPPMGWNSWNWHGKKNINERVVLETIDAMVSTGLKAAGYQYVVIDGGWRDSILGENGELKWNTTKFPNGIKYLADYAHSKGLKLGVHVVPGSHDCGRDNVGGFGHEETHVKQFVEWGLDFIKLDLCTHKFDPCSDCNKYNYGWAEESIAPTYKKWQNLLENCGRDIVLSISAYQFRDWYPETCNMARTTGDIEARIHKGAFFHTDTIEHTFFSVLDIAEINNASADQAGNGYWNDPDMLVTGAHGLNEKEQVTHFNLWCIMSAPLFIGSDPRVMTDFEQNLLTNQELLTVNQDPTEQGRLIKRDGVSQIWHKKLRNGESALLFLGLKRRRFKNININLKEIGFDKNAKVKDITNNKHIELKSDYLSFDLLKNESVMVIVSK